MFWTTSTAAAAAAAQVAVRMETMRKAEAGLIYMANRFGKEEEVGGEEGNSSSSYRMHLFDTDIPISVLPFHQPSTKKKSSYWNWNPFSSIGNCKDKNDDDDDDEEEQLTMHAIQVTKDEKEGAVNTRNKYPQKYPLVIVHGYMNGALYFYRNLIGLANYFDTVISVDLLGWGLSSRPSWDRLIDDSVQTTEDFFVESLETWRSKNDIDKMVLAGHSLGGYVSVAYCEKYPHRVDRLLLLSPAGIPDDSPERIAERRSKFLTSYSRKFVYGLFGKLWEYGITPGSVMRTISESRGRTMVEGYVKNRLPSITDEEEQSVLAEYMYTGSILPGSGEYGLNQLLNPGAIAKKPCLHRIPKLQVSQISFFYGVQDWMDVHGGLDVQTICRDKQQQQQQQQQRRRSKYNNNNADEDDSSAVERIVPNVDVYQVRNAGHLLMLENSPGFNAAIVYACGGNIANVADLPIVVTKTSCSDDDEETSKNTTVSRSTDSDSNSSNNGDDGGGVQVAT